jgi:hypothetical protein
LPTLKAAAIALLLLAPRFAFADTCGRPDLLETIPADGSTGVPLNATLSARYAASAQYVEEMVTLEHVGVGPEAATAHFDSNEGLLTLTPKAPLVALAPYKITWPALRGLSTAVLGNGAEVKFTAGSAADGAAPTFAGVESVDWDVERANDDCTNGAEDRFVFDIGLSAASDDAKSDLLTLVVFQTAGHGANAGSPEPVLVQRFPDAGNKVEVRRALDAAEGEVCFAALVRDTVGQISSSADHEVCTKTVKPPFFYGCTMTASAAPSGCVAPALIGIFWASRRRRDRRVGGQRARA